MFETPFAQKDLTKRGKLLYMKVPYAGDQQGLTCSNSKKYFMCKLAYPELMFLRVI